MPIPNPERGNIDQGFSPGAPCAVDRGGIAIGGAGPGEGPPLPAEAFWDNLIETRPTEACSEAVLELLLLKLPERAEGSVHNKAPDIPLSRHHHNGEK